MINNNINFLNYYINLQTTIELAGHNSRINCINLSQDEQYVITASDDCSARIWEADTGQQLVELQGHQKGVVYANFSADSTQAITTSKDYTICIWKTLNGSKLYQILPEGPFYPLSANFSDDGTKIISSNMTYISIWNALTYQLCLKIENVAASYFTYFSKDSNKFLSTNYSSNQVLLWDSKTGHTLGDLTDFSQSIDSACFSNHGEFIATISDVGTVCLWDVNKKTKIHTLCHLDRVFSASFSPNDERIATTARDDTLRVWRVANGEQIAYCNFLSSSLHSVFFCSNAKSMITLTKDIKTHICTYRKFSLTSNLHYKGMKNKY